MLRPAKVRMIREGIAEMLNRADRAYLRAQTDKEAFAESLAWELANAGHCTQDEYEREVLPYLRTENEYVDCLRRTALAGQPLDPDDVGLFSALLKRIGREIREARRERGWSQADLAEAAGTFQPVVSRVERGESLKQPTLELLDRFAAALGKRLVLQLTEEEVASRKTQGSDHQSARAIKMHPGDRRDKRRKADTHAVAYRPEEDLAAEELRQLPRVAVTRPSGKTRR